MGRKPANPIEKARAERRRRRDAAFAARHPDKAREERELRKANRAVRANFGHKVNGTPETHAKARVDDGALARLYRSGAIDAHQLADACEIRAIAQRIGADVAIGTVSLETRVDQSRRFDGTFYEKLGAVRAEVAYGRWRAWLHNPAVVLAMIVDDVPYSQAARRFRMRAAKAKAMLISALDAWPDFQRDARDEIDERRLRAAEAAILRGGPKSTLQIGT